MSRTEFAYAQARLQARHGARPDAAQWRALDGSRTAAQYLALARAGPLARWTEGLDERAVVHHAEALLRERWRHTVDEVARWLPPRWRAATREFGALVELPLRAEADTAARWLAQWQRLWPADATEDLRRPAEWLLPRLAGRRIGRGADDPAVPEALRRVLRRHAASPSAVIAFVALQALDFERLRGGLVQRLLFVRTTAGDA